MLSHSGVADLDCSGDFCTTNTTTCEELGDQLDFIAFKLGDNYFSINAPGYIYNTTAVAEGDPICNIGITSTSDDFYHFGISFLRNYYVVMNAAITDDEPNGFIKFSASLAGNGVVLTSIGSSDDGSLSGGAIFGIIAGVIIVMVVVVLVICCCVKKARKNRTNDATQQYGGIAATASDGLTDN